jgi:hypothetical protein
MGSVPARAVAGIGLDDLKCKDHATGDPIFPEKPRLPWIHCDFQSILIEKGEID